MLKTFTIQDIRSWEPCYDPAKHLPENWVGTVIDILRHNTIPAADKLWVVLREELIDAKTLRLFAVWCGRRVEHMLTDERSKNALTVAEKFANGIASQNELTAASAAARAAAWAGSAAARDAARAASDAVWAAASDAAWAAASDAAWEASAGAWAASAAAWAAASDASAGAWAAAWAAASEAASDAQINHLIAMITEQQVNNA